MKDEKLILKALLVLLTRTKRTTPEFHYEVEREMYNVTKEIRETLAKEGYYL